MKECVQVVILNENGEVLAVSRKHDHNDFGLVGGKVDKGETPIQAIMRETKEETGLFIYEGGLIPIFQMHRDGYMGYTYLSKVWDGEIETDEPHIVKWTTFDEIMRGTFGKWNTLVAESLISMGRDIKMDDGYCEICKNTGKVAGIFDEDDIRDCHGIKHSKYLK